MLQKHQIVCIIDLHLTSNIQKEIVIISCKISRIFESKMYLRTFRQLSVQLWDLNKAEINQPSSKLVSMHRITFPVFKN